MPFSFFGSRAIFEQVQIVLDMALKKAKLSSEKTLLIQPKTISTGLTLFLEGHQLKHILGEKPKFLRRIQIPARNSFLWAAATTKVPPEVTKASNPHPLDE